ncbi:hypothetical protein QA640_04580 [Bradyrhizobium sp. CB82]|uniref:hypothetical protein n=1 Tax=Bradyrhizobium sp. CB82 TaxID=3039159 RepID=UPI0024B15105|nr:hypothetical protein [Bradyrhizobium sp. CB82]WFU41792.1 hypothetical protein QA640_04580 [Bradyrhizobium sp. CB82]
MGALSDRILKIVSQQPGIPDRWLAELLFGPGTAQQRVNGECRSLAAKGLLERAQRADGLIGNFVTTEQSSASVVVEGQEMPPAPYPHSTSAPFMSEDVLKKMLQSWLITQGWTVEVAWARAPGIDIHARQGGRRWIIEAKGEGTLAPMRVNYFLGVLGETLQRMTDPQAAYSVAFPDLKQFRGLWARLPNLAKERTKISALFVSHGGNIEQIT